MDKSRKILSDLTVHMKYARWLEKENRRETWEEIVDRTSGMHQKKFPMIDYLTKSVFNLFVKTKRVLPSMRSLQFGGLPIERNNSRIYNCAYLPLSSPQDLKELMFLLLGGTGVGYSVQQRHVKEFPVITLGKGGTHDIEDTIEGWADAIERLIENPITEFSYSLIRPKGSPLKVTGGLAPGPEPLRLCIEKIRGILLNAVDRRPTSLELHDIACHIADAVLVGGIRRAALISLFSKDDNDMIMCKSGKWYETNPQRARANNSIVLLRGTNSLEEFLNIWKKIENSNAGEPGIYWTNNLDWGTNPCAEIALKPYQFCNLVEINIDAVKSYADWINSCEAASYIATLQASYTDFTYLRPIWKTTTEEEALIGVGCTGIASNKVSKKWLQDGVTAVEKVNNLISRIIGINEAARTTTVKPAGTSSLVLGCSSGIHGWYDEYYIRRITINKTEKIYSYLKQVIPQLIEDNLMNPDNEAFVAIPQQAPVNATLRHETPQELFNRVIEWNENWVRPGSKSSVNMNNVSATIFLKPDEWDDFGREMFETSYAYNGISVFPYDSGTYKQTPFETITKEEYERLSQFVKNIDLTKVHENADYTDLSAELACAGGACEIR